MHRFDDYSHPEILGRMTKYEQAKRRGFDDDSLNNPSLLDGVDKKSQASNEDKRRMTQETIEIRKAAAAEFKAMLRRNND